MKSITVFASAFFLALLGVSSIVTPLEAAVSCQPVYGGGQTCIQVGNIVINKTVAHPQTSAFVDNLGQNDAKFRPEQVVTFQIVVTNVSDSDIARVTVTDTYPNFVSFSGGPGNFDANTKVLTFSFDGLRRGESKTFTLQGVVAPANQLPADKGVVCVVNQAFARSEPTGDQAQDNAQFCIEKQVVGVDIVPGKGGPQIVQQPTPVTVVPKTGPELAALAGLFSTGALGVFLRRLSKSA
jgi:uncharacterized repeat protein (TIGR01451 family)